MPSLAESAPCEVYIASPDGSTMPVPTHALPVDLVIVPAETCPNCGLVEGIGECQCGDLRDCW
jgi:hypothetical protein